jgi:17beta-estradiol 17-dehydrogenase / very-long-chain 3-oxoacyl-CoA reductase
VTGSTSGIGKDFADHLASLGMSLLIISRTESRLKEQQKELQEKYKDIQVKYLAFDFTKSGNFRQYNYYFIINSLFYNKSID